MTEQEQRLQAIWERAAARAITTGFDPPMVLASMLVASTKALIEGAANNEGMAALSGYFGRLADACESAAGGQPFVQPNIN